MARRPEGMSLEEWRAQRAAYWKRVNRTLNLLMVLAIAALIWRYYVRG